MAIYHLNAKFGSKGKEASAGAKSDYITREGKYEKGAKEVVYKESCNMPAWAKNENYWHAADKHERASGKLYWQVEFSLPVELKQNDQIKLAKNFSDRLANVNDLSGKCPYTLAIHRGNDNNPHAHLILSERCNDGIERDPQTWFKRGNKKNLASGGAIKTKELQDVRWLGNVRTVWADYANSALEKAGQKERIDHRSYTDQGIIKIPQIHLGANVVAMEAKGIKTRKFEEYLSIEAQNANFESSKKQLEEIDNELERSRKNLADAKSKDDIRNSDLIGNPGTTLAGNTKSIRDNKDINEQSKSNSGVIGGIKSAISGFKNRFGGLKKQNKETEKKNADSSDPIINNNNNLVRPVVVQDGQNGKRNVSVSKPTTTNRPGTTLEKPETRVEKDKDQKVKIEIPKEKEQEQTAEISSAKIALKDLPLKDLLEKEQREKELAQKALDDRKKQTEIVQVESVKFYCETKLYGSNAKDFEIINKSFYDDICKRCKHEKTNLDKGYIDFEGNKRVIKLDKDKYILAYNKEAIIDFEREPISYQRQTQQQDRDQSQMYSRKTQQQEKEQERETYQRNTVISKAPRERE